MSIQWSLRPAIKRLAQIKDWLVFFYFPGPPYSEQIPLFSDNCRRQAKQRGTKCVSECVFTLIAPILSVWSGHFLLAGVQHRGPVSEEGGQRPHWAKAHTRAGCLQSSSAFTHWFTFNEILACRKTFRKYFMHLLLDLPLILYRVSWSGCLGFLDELLHLIVDI